MKQYEDIIHELTINYEHYSNIESITVLRQLIDKLDCEINVHEIKLLMLAIEETRKYCVSLLSAKCKN